MNRAYDLVIFGASGFTGQFVVQEVAKRLTDHTTWAVAGRSSEKLEALKKKFSLSCGVILANVSDGETLRKMSRSTRTLINCVGPYRYLGETVVDACVHEATDYLDICGEPEFLERIEAKYHDAALEKGCVVVGSCAFDSVPADLGVQFAKLQFEPPATCCQIETFLSLDAPYGYSAHLTTFECAVAGIANAHELREMRKKGRQPPRSIRGPQLQRRDGPFKDPRLPGEICFAFPGSDSSVIRRTENALASPDETTIQAACYFHMSSWWNVLKTVFFGGAFRTLASTETGRQALLIFPWCLSGGAFSREGPTPTQIATTTFTLNIFAKGYSDANEKLVFDKQAKVRVSGPDPGYVGTATMVVALAETVLKERDRIPKGGVLTPGTCFAKTEVVKTLTTRGVVFEVL